MVDFDMDESSYSFLTHLPFADASLMDKIYFYLGLIFKWIKRRLNGVDYVIAHLKDGRILVPDVNVKGLQLWKDGFYGRGTLSRGAPTWAMRKNLEDKAESLYEAKNRSSFGNRGVEVEEYIISSEEALYLSAKEKLLIYSTDSSNSMTVKELWDTFSEGSDVDFENLNELSSRFALRFSVYHYYRSKKWIVRPGLKYGADFVLYRKGPSIDHSKYVVVILPTMSDNYVDKDWRWVLRMSRLCSQVRKKLICCFVELPQGLKASDLSRIEVLSKIRIWDVEFSRWIPSLTL